MGTASLARVRLRLALPIITHNIPSAHAREILGYIHDVQHMLLALRPSRFSRITFKSCSGSGLGARLGKQYSTVYMTELEKLEEGNLNLGTGNPRASPLSV